MTELNCIVRLKEIVHANLPLLDKSRTNQLPRRLQRATRAQANKHGAWKVSNDDHAFMMAEANMREGQGYDSDIQFDANDEGLDLSDGDNDGTGDADVSEESESESENEDSEDEEESYDD